jgi:hypothetical protein
MDQIAGYNDMPPPGATLSGHCWHKAEERGQKRPSRQRAAHNQSSSRHFIRPSIVDGNSGAALHALSESREMPTNKGLPRHKEQSWIFPVNVDAF